MKILVSGAGMLGCNLARNFMMKAEKNIPYGRSRKRTAAGIRRNNPKV